MIIGKKVKLRAIEESDLSLMVQWINDPQIAHLVGGWDFPISLAQQREWFKSTFHNKHTQRWIIETHTGESIGLTGLWDIDWHNRHAFTGIKLGADDMRGKGYGTDAIMTVMSYAFFQVGLNRLWTNIIDYNIASYKTYVINCGWKVEGILRQSIFRDGRYYDQLRVGILKEEFVKLPQAKEYIPLEENKKIKIDKSHLAPFLVEVID